VSYVSPWWQALNLPDRWDVAGVVVPSLTVWHSLALSQIGNAYAFDLPANRDDAAGLLVVCSHTMDEYRGLLFNRRRLSRALARVHRKVRGVEWSRLDAACREYVSGCTRHMLRVSDDKGSPAVAPHEWHLVRVLCDTYHMSLPEAWGTPYALARCLYDVHAEANGDRNIAPPAVQRDADMASGEALP
jgi:hypothetical protein